MSALQSPLAKLSVAALVIGGFEATVLTLPHLSVASTNMVLLRSAMLIGGSVAAILWLVQAGPIPAAIMGWKRPTGGTLGWGSLCLFVTFAVSGIMLSSMQALGIKQNAAVLAAITSRPAWLMALIALAAAISEEIVFRGILLNYIASATGRIWLGAVVSLAVFALAHLNGWGWNQVLFAGTVGLVPTLFFLWKRDLGLCIFAHFVTDFLGFLSMAMQTQNT